MMNVQQTAPEETDLQIILLDVENCRLTSAALQVDHLQMGSIVHSVDRGVAVVWMLLWNSKNTQA